MRAVLSSSPPYPIFVALDSASYSSLQVLLALLTYSSKPTGSRKRPNYLMKSGAAFGDRGTEPAFATIPSVMHIRTVRFGDTQST